jgi:hypothetical protein
MRRSTLALLSVVVALGLFAVGCDSTGSLSDGDSGTLELSMNDATTSKSLSTLSTTSSAQDSVAEATVTITEMSIVPAEDTSDGNSTDTGISVLLDEDFEVDLIDLQTGLDTTLAELDIPAGDYSQIRLTTNEKVSVIFNGGTQEDVMIASDQLKVNFDPFTIESADDRAEVTLNWNVQQSLKGNPQGTLVITPVIDASVNVINAGS